MGLLYFNLFEVFHYWTDVPLWLAHFIFMMNLDKWNSLPPDIQKAIMGVSGMNGAKWGEDAVFGPDVQDDTMAKVRKAGPKYSARCGTSEKKCLGSENLAGKNQGFWIMKIRLLMTKSSFAEKAMTAR